MRAIVNEEVIEFRDDRWVFTALPVAAMVFAFGWIAAAAAVALAAISAAIVAVRSRELLSLELGE